MQMITLYKDPQGKSIMTVEEALTRERAATMPKRDDKSFIVLRKRIQDLETTITRYKVDLKL